MPAKLLKKAVLFHGHACPGLAIGARAAGLALREFFAGRARDEEIVAIVENDSCAVDAIQALTGCTFGKGNLIFRDYGKQVYTFIKRPSKGRKAGKKAEALRVSLKWSAPPETPLERDIWRKYASGDRSEGVLKAVRSRKQKKIKAILEAADEELFDIKRMRMEPPCEAGIFTSVTCALCGEKTMETRAKVLGGRALCGPCFEKEMAKRCGN